MSTLATLKARLARVEPAPAWSLTTGLALLIGYFVTRVAALALVSVLADTEAAARGVFSPLTAHLAGIVTGIITLILIALVLRRSVPADLAGALRLRHWPGPLFVLMILALATAILIDFVPLIFQRISLPVSLQGMSAAGQADWLVAALHLVIIAPLAEMALVQGVLYPALAARHGNRTAILLCAVIYTVIQVFDDPANFILGSTALLSGLFLTGVRAHEQSTRAAVIAAAMFGLFALFKALRLFL